MKDRNERRQVLVDELDPYGDGKYVSLLGNFYRLPALLRQITGYGCMCFTCKVKYTVALISWQEVLTCIALLAWTVISLTPNCFSSGWPFSNVILWGRMQLDFLRHAKLWALGQLAAVCCFGFWCYVTWRDWSGRRKDLVATRNQRLGLGFGMQMPEWLLPAAGDTQGDTLSKAARLRLIYRRAMEPASMWERLRLPAPTFVDLLWLCSMLYGGFAYGVADVVLRPDSPWRAALLAPRYLPAAWVSGLYHWETHAVVGTIVGAAAVYGLACVVSNRRMRVWLELWNITRKEIFAAWMGRKSMDEVDMEAMAYTSYVRGHTLPTVASQLWAWLLHACRYMLGLWFGAVIAGWLLYPAYLPAYAVPSYGTPAMSVPHVWAGPGVKPAAAPGAASRIAGCGSAGGGGPGLLGRVACDLRAGARVNLLAARAWQAGGLDGVQAAMEALRAACSEEAAWDAQLAAKAQAALRRAQSRWHYALSGVPWEVGGRWALGMAWERLGEGWVQRGQSNGDRELGQTGKPVEGLSGRSAQTDSTVDSDAPPAGPSGPVGSSGGAGSSGKQEAVASLHVCPVFEVPPWGFRCAARGGADASGDVARDELGGGSGSRGAGSEPQARARRAQPSVPLSEDRSSATQPEGAKAGASTGDGGSGRPKAAPAAAKAHGSQVPWQLLVNLAVAAPLAVWLLAFRPIWLRSPEKLLDAVTGLIKAATGPRGGRGRKRSADSAGGRKAAPKGDASAKRGPQPAPPPPPQQQQVQQQSSSKRLLLTGLAESATSPAPNAAAAPSQRTNSGQSSSGGGAAGSGSSSSAGRDANAGRSSGGRAAAAASAPARSQPPKPAAKPASTAAASAGRRNARTAFVRGTSLAATDAAPPHQQSGVLADAAQDADDSAGWQTAGGRGASGPRSSATSLAAALPFTATLANKPREEDPRAPPPAAFSEPSHAASSGFWGWGRAAAAAAVPPAAAAAWAQRQQPPSWGAHAHMPPAGSRSAPAAPAAPSAAAAGAWPAPGGQPSSSSAEEADLPIPIPIPVPSPSSAGADAPPPQPARPAASGAAKALLGLNPALSRFLGPAHPSPAAAAPPGHGVAAAQAAAAAGAGGKPQAAAAAAGRLGGAAVASAPIPPPAPGRVGGFWGSAPNLDPKLCVRCQAAPRQLGILHGDSAHLCFCRGCGAGFAVGDPCPMCGEPAQRLLMCY